MTFPHNDQALAPSSIKPAGKRDAFIGSLGLRAGWGLTFFLLLAFAFGSGIGYLAIHVSGLEATVRAQQQQAKENAREAKAQHAVPPLQSLSLPLAFINEAALVGGPVLAALVLAYVERRRFRVYGLARYHVRDLLPGALWGFFSMSTIVVLLRSLKLLIFDIRLLNGSAIFRYGLEWFLVAFLIGIAEEFLFRGYIQFTLMRGLLGLGKRLAPNNPRRAAFWMSSLVWSLLFSAGHLPNAGENPIGLISVFGAGILFSYALWRTGSLWWGIGFHMTWDWSQSFLFGTPDSGTLSAGRLFQTHAAGAPLLSGGVDGPEGSLFGMLVFFIAFLALQLQPQAAQPPVEPELVSSAPIFPAAGA